MVTRAFNPSTLEAQTNKIQISICKPACDTATESGKGDNSEACYVIDIHLSFYNICKPNYSQNLNYRTFYKF